jgi:hypothetical protein
MSKTTCPFEFVNLKKRFEIEPPELDFVLAGTVGGLVSPGGVGKSTFALMVALTITNGEEAIHIDVSNLEPSK